MMMLLPLHNVTKTIFQKTVIIQYLKADMRFMAYTIEGRKQVRFHVPSSINYNVYSLRNIG